MCWSFSSAVCKTDENGPANVILPAISTLIFTTNKGSKIPPPIEFKLKKSLPAD